jgi:hypothetical protein
LRRGITSLRDRLHHYWNDLSAKAKPEGFGNVQTFKAPAAKLPRSEASRLPLALDVAAVPIQSVYGIKVACEPAVRGGNMDDE